MSKAPHFVPDHSHAIERARERYGISLIEADIIKMRAEIMEGRSLLSSKDVRGEVHLIQYLGTPMKVCWNPGQRDIVSVLPWSTNGKMPRPTHDRGFSTKRNRQWRKNQSR